MRRRIIDFGLQGYFTSHHPVMVPEPFTLEPSRNLVESSDLEEYGDVLTQIDERREPIRSWSGQRPTYASVHRIHEEAIDTPAQWAMTWRGFRRKYGRAAGATEPVLTN